MKLARGKTTLIFGGPRIWAGSGDDASCNFHFHKSALSTPGLLISIWNRPDPTGAIHIIGCVLQYK